MRTEADILEELKLLRERRPDGWIIAYISLRWVLGEDAGRVRHFEISRLVGKQVSKKDGA